MRPRPGDVFWANTPILGRTGEHKRRPALVVSTDSFTQRTGLVHLVPISTKPKTLNTLPPRMAEGLLPDNRSEIVVDVAFTEPLSVLAEKIGRIHDDALSAAVAALRSTYAD